MFEKGFCLLMEGDSITDCGRTWGDKSEWNNHIGMGYSKMVIETLKNLYQSNELKTFNRAISGSKLKDLIKRLDDSLSVNPNLVTILIGINDIWRSFDSNEIIDFSDFEKDFEKLISSAQKVGAKVLVIEPFTFLCGAVNKEWETPLKKIIAIEKKVAKKLGTAYLSLKPVFNKALKIKECEALIPDGVHPNEECHRLIAIEVLKKLEVFN